MSTTETAVTKQKQYKQPTPINELELVLVQVRIERLIQEIVKKHEEFKVKSKKYVYESEGNKKVKVKDQKPTEVLSNSRLARDAITFIGITAQIVIDHLFSLADFNEKTIQFTLNMVYSKEYELPEYILKLLGELPTYKYNSLLRELQYLKYRTYCGQKTEEILRETVTSNVTNVDTNAVANGTAVASTTKKQTEEELAKKKEASKAKKLALLDKKLTNGPEEKKNSSVYIDNFKLYDEQRIAHINKKINELEEIISEYGSDHLTCLGTDSAEEHNTEEAAEEHPNKEITPRSFGHFIKKNKDKYVNKALEHRQNKEEIVRFMNKTNFLTFSCNIVYELIVLLLVSVDEIIKFKDAKTISLEAVRCRLYSLFSSKDLINQFETEYNRYNEYNKLLVEENKRKKEEAKVNESESLTTDVKTEAAPVVETSTAPVVETSTAPVVNNVTTNTNVSTNASTTNSTTPVTTLDTTTKPPTKSTRGRSKAK